MYLKKFALFFYSILVFSLSSVYSQDIEKPQDKVSYVVSVDQNNCDAEIIVNVQIINDWHINAANLPKESFSIPTQINFDSSKYFTFNDSITEPEFEKTYDSIAKEWLYLHDGNIKFKKRIRLNSEDNFKLKGEFVYQTCDDKHCLPIFSEKFELNISGCNTHQEIKNDNEEINDSSNTGKILIVILIVISLIIIVLFKINEN
jgi:hypothetical protein